MALTADGFKRPTGRLSESWFTVEDDLDGILEALITEAGTKGGSDAAQTAWVYYRVYSMLADDAAMRPGLESADDIRRAYGADQRAYWKRQADEFLAEYQGLAGLLVGGPVFQEVGYE